MLGSSAQGQHSTVQYSTRGIARLLGTLGSAAAAVMAQVSVLLPTTSIICTVCTHHGSGER